MMKLVIIGGIVAFLTALLGALAALRMQQRLLSEKQAEREAWERAQGSQQLAWEMHQRKYLLEVEQQLTGRVEHIQEEWKQWDARFNDHSQKLSQEYALNTLPKVEEIPLALDGHHHFSHAPANWQPPTFYKADLRQRDFSHRFLGQVNFREAQLVRANFYMADLRGSCLAGANLAGANLTGANLTDADLRGANLVGANLLVSDLHHAILNGANLLKARNLTTQQLFDAIYDHTTQLDPEVDITIKRIPVTPVKNTVPSIVPELMKPTLESSLLLPPSPDTIQPIAGPEGFQAAKTENAYSGALDRAFPRIRQNGTNRTMAG